MNVVIHKQRLASILSSEKSIRKKYGQEMAKKITIRVNALAAAHSLGDFWSPYSGPERCHELKGDLSGYFSFDLKHPYRLRARPLKDISKREFPSEKDRWSEIKDLAIENITDTHG